jgi:hypothetical protein
MATPRYVAKKIGDQYVLQRKDPTGAVQDVLFAALGGVVTLCGLHRRGPLGWFAVFTGASMICRGVTGNNPFCRMAACRPQLASLDAGPSHQNDARSTSQAPIDPVEEASMESFPGSDPPARNAVATVGGPVTPELPRTEVHEVR